MDLPHAARSLAARTVHIKLYPTARTLAERREVLRVLERYGEVEMFRSLKHQPIPTPNAFMSIFQTESAAREAINNSPIRYRLITAPAPSDPESPNLDSISSAESSPEPEVSPEHEKAFQMECSPSSYPHAERLSSEIYNPLGNGFRPVSPRHSPIAAALQEVVPKSLRSAGLVDWETDGLKRRAAMNFDMTTEVPWRVQAKEKEKERGKLVTSLKELWERGQEERRVGGG